MPRGGLRFAHAERTSRNPQHLLRVFFMPGALRGAGMAAPRGADCCQ